MRREYKEMIDLVKIHYPISIGLGKYSDNKGNMGLDFINTDDVHNYLQVLCLIHNVLPRYEMHPLLDCIKNRKHKIYRWIVTIVFPSLYM